MMDVQTTAALPPRRRPRGAQRRFGGGGATTTSRVAEHPGRARSSSAYFGYGSTSSFSLGAHVARWRRCRKTCSAAPSFWRRPRAVHQSAAASRRPRVARAARHGNHAGETAAASPPPPKARPCPFAVILARPSARSATPLQRARWAVPPDDGGYAQQRRRRCRGLVALHIQEDERHTTRTPAARLRVEHDVSYARPYARGVPSAKRPSPAP